MNISHNFIQYLKTKEEQINKPVIEKAKDCLCDYLAVTEAGARACLPKWNYYLSHIPDGRAQIIGAGRTADSRTACLINGFHAHCLELDDGHRFAMAHPGAAVITALLAAASENEISREDFLRGMILGYEAMCRLSISIQPSHKLMGLHASGTCGTVGAALGVAFAMRMDKERLFAVLSAAVCGAAGPLEILENPSELKPYNLGRAAMDGLSAAYMGFTGFSGPKDILNGERGFFHLFSREFSPEKLTEDQSYFEMERIYFKPYAACRHCHGAIEAMLALRDQFAPADVQSIVVETYGLAIRGHNHTEITGSASAKLSTPYSVAAACLLGTAGAEAFSDSSASNADILALARKITIVENNEFSNCCPNKRISKVTVELKNGTLLSHQTDYAKGEPENPMSRDEIKNKAVELNGIDQAQNIFECVYARNRSKIIEVL